MKDKAIEEAELEQAEEVSDELLTEVTSIKQEEIKSGQEIPIPDPEQLVANASASFIRDRANLNRLIGGMGKGALKRAIIAILDLPSDKMPVKLISKEEKDAFLVGQRMINNRFLITQHHIVNEKKRLKKLMEEQQCNQKQKQSSSESDGLTKRKTEPSTSQLDQAESDKL